MGNEFRELQSHSAEYFGDTRDHWWNPDFIDLMAKRWELYRAREVLDIGCGVGHWGRLLARVLPTDARVTGVDRDSFWVERAAERAAAASHSLSVSFRYEVASVERLPFENDTFDLVTCQTVLIHVPDRKAALAEMIRVTKPGGLIAVAEPNNAASSLVLDETAFHAPVDEIVGIVRFQLVCERGKAALGEGNNSAGELMPALFAASGLSDVRVYLNDKASPLFPPYSTPEQRAAAEEIIDFARRAFWIWSHEDTRRYFIAGGGRADDFEPAWQLAMTASRRFAETVARGTGSLAGGAICYLVSGRKPPAAPKPR
ncbi:MAG: class I SAM-dependent methyltransferase [Polyangiaceae bacterium]|nr:class I SAM-dependent methyltransferase [Polyangiaceae bacterium]NUQ72193.1 class I SAM-dependent methyltransferase [Polyangiaceae bacterium]